tara:strand:- start:851 stop:1057 length:207 start_codon:yes stop_codon:yes gene_type:complete
MKILALVLKSVSGLFSKPAEITKGVSEVTSYRKTKKVLTLLIIAVLGLLLFFDKIDMQTFIKLFKEVE